MKIVTSKRTSEWLQKKNVHEWMNLSLRCESSNLMSQQLSFEYCIRARTTLLDDKQFAPFTFYSCAAYNNDASSASKPSSMYTTE